MLDNQGVLVVPLKGLKHPWDEGWQGSHLIGSYFEKKIKTSSTMQKESPPPSRKTVCVGRGVIPWVGRSVPSKSGQKKKKGGQFLDLPKGGPGEGR